MLGREPVSVPVSLCCDAIKDKWCREKWKVREMESKNTGGDSSAEMIKRINKSYNIYFPCVFLSNDAIDPLTLFTPLILIIMYFAEDQKSQERNYC